VFDNLSCGHKEVLPPGIKLIVGDLRKFSEISSALSTEKFEAVMHFAAFTIVPESIEDPRKYFDNNVMASINLLNAMVDNGVKRFVFSSSAATYGNPENVPVTENEPTKPANAYGETKLIVEQYLKWYETAYGIKYVCLRYFNAAGADLENDIGEDREIETHLIPLVLHAAAGIKDRVLIFGNDYPTRDGTCVRDYIHVKDLASAHVKALQKLSGDKAVSAIYNLGSESGFTVSEVVAAVEKVTKKKVNAVISPRRPGDPPLLIASSSKIKKELGWSQKYSALDRIISDTWEWMQKHPRGYST
jgi:UDP-glucose 4-epimerase